MTTPKEEPAGGTSAAAALFQGNDDSLAEGFRDKVALLHAHFDRDGDGHLNHAELRGLQLLTSGSDMDAGQYVMVCRSLACDPSKGISVDALKVVYASEGASVEEDYMKVLGKGKKETNASERPEGSDDDVLEVGEDGVDISS